MQRLTKRHWFPPAADAPADEPLAIGGDLAPERVELAYRQGIFPWPVPGLPLLWWSPDPRCVLAPQAIRVSRSLRRTLRQGIYEVRYDTAARAVITHCARIPRPGQSGTWITDDVIEAYVELHRRGIAHTVEAYADDQLQGGLYGLSFGHAFFGESMFSLAPDASKVAFVALARRLEAWRFELIDCQVPTPHTLRFGAREVSRAEFLRQLHRALAHPTRRGPWTLNATPPATPRDA